MQGPDHAGIIMAGDVAAVLQLYHLFEMPNNLALLARCQQHAVGIIVGHHHLAVTMIHLHFRVIDTGGGDHAMFRHHGHFLLMLGMHRGRSDIEFMQKFTVIADDETDGFTFVDFYALNTEIVIHHDDSYGAVDLTRITRRANVGGMAVVAILLMPALMYARAVAFIIMTARMFARRGGHRGEGRNGKHNTSG